MPLPLLLVLASLAVTSVDADADGNLRASFPVMGTKATLVLAGTDRAGAARAAHAAREELERLEAMMSEWRPDSALSRVNAAAGSAAVPVPPELLEVLVRSLEIARLSGGAFDPTWAGLRGLWKFGDGQDGTVPNQAEIDARLQLVDWRRVRVDPQRRTVLLELPGMALGLGGIAKGFAVDSVVARLRELGHRDFLVQVGGDLYAAGRKRADAPWTVGIRDPRGPGIFASVPLGDASFSTSGDYEHAFVRDGVRYHHIIDPSTGRPAAASRSVTARCRDAYTADAVTKPVFILGPEKGIPFALALGCEVVVVDAANHVHLSPGLTGEVRWTPPTP